MGSIPNQYYYDVNTFFIALFQLITICLWYCGTGGQIICSTTHIALRVLVVQPIGFWQDSSVFIMLSKVFMVIVYFLASGSIAVVI